MEQNVTESVPLRAHPLALPTPTPVRWNRSARARRVSLRIDPRAGEVVVTLPMRSGRRAGLQLLTTHAAWVKERLASLAPAVPLSPGQEVNLGGLPHVIRHDPALRGPATLAPGAILVGGDGEFVARRVADFLRAEGRRRICERVAVHAARLGVKAKRITLKDTRSRWGSCAPDGSLAFSWRLVMAPDWVLDYVVAHEVAHLRELNHSARFWTLVTALTPDRDAAQEWLRKNGPALLRVG
ncbi:M48 family metallopeptidase [Roseomonas sp. CCTCC AB2023176]|uniref:M48 family metallopeptidase n=1 Tax=Roseomonas sp. CCTCC AB2023176 TaxID=3342640 RepID=UPI0035D726FF